MVKTGENRLRDDDVRTAYEKAGRKLEETGFTDRVKRAVAHILDCDPWELQDWLDRQPDEGPEWL